MFDATDVEPQEPVSTDSLRCRFTFKDGRRCKMPLHNHLAGLCLIHERNLRVADAAEAAEIAQVLLGGRTKITNIDEMNKILSRLFILIARKRIQRNDGALLAYVASLLLSGLSRQQDRLKKEQKDVEIIWDLLTDPPSEPTPPSNPAADDAGDRDVKPDSAGTD